MSPGLLAPQFGLGRISPSDLDDRVEHDARLRTASAAFVQSGPTVTVKRRRLVEVSATTGTDQQAPAEAKVSKVYRLEAPAVLPETDQVPPAVAEGSQPDLPSIPKSRRRTDQVRKPTLVRHVVFEPKASVHPPPNEAPTSGDQPFSKVEVFQAMERMQETLDAMVHAHEAYVALDKHLKALGV